MSVELEYQNERYMVDGGQWYRRLEAGEVVSHKCQYAAYEGWVATTQCGYEVGCSSGQYYRVPCVDPRPPFQVGDRVKVARKDESWGGWNHESSFHLGRKYEVDSIDQDGVVGFETGVITVTRFPPWCLDLIEEPSNPQPKETAKVKFTQWQLREAKEPKTLADVASSREKPVLCWWLNEAIRPTYRDGLDAYCKGRDGKWLKCSGCDMSSLELYQPSAPTFTLETLPDYRVVLCDGMAYFRCDGQWFDAYVTEPDGFDPTEIGPDIDFTVTPYEAYLAEVDLTGGAK